MLQQTVPVLARDPSEPRRGRVMGVVQPGRVLHAKHDLVLGAVLTGHPTMRPDQRGRGHSGIVEKAVGAHQIAPPRTLPGQRLRRRRAHGAGHPDESFERRASPRSAPVNWLTAHPSPIASEHAQTDAFMADLPVIQVIRQSISHARTSPIDQTATIATVVYKGVTGRERFWSSRLDHGSPEHSHPVVPRIRLVVVRTSRRDD